MDSFLWAPPHLGEAHAATKVVAARDEGCAVPRDLGLLRSRPARHRSPKGDGRRTAPPTTTSSSPSLPRPPRSRRFAERATCSIPCALHRSARLGWSRGSARRRSLSPPTERVAPPVRAPRRDSGSGVASFRNAPRPAFPDHRPACFLAEARASRRGDVADAELTLSRHVLHKRGRMPRRSRAGAAQVRRGDHAELISQLREDADRDARKARRTVGVGSATSRSSTEDVDARDGRRLKSRSTPWTLFQILEVLARKSAPLRASPPCWPQFLTHRLVDDVHARLLDAAHLVGRRRAFSFHPSALANGTIRSACTLRRAAGGASSWPTSSARSADSARRAGRGQRLALSANTCV